MMIVPKIPNHNTKNNQRINKLRPYFSRSYSSCFCSHFCPRFSS
ncbi:hypothetical protein CY0110_18737 [Crocosphaera chwakensis CCY0110]|uniref:Uncharacterized protein n=1 Tax=Crocosphaera chwakensis CCY0110 TaxID=391612 RepID=A3IJ79_9CHRO|nr:hypothetical protein CY0110_18737 [Crocosphaera chwakensis CCY0110]